MISINCETQTSVIRLLKVRGHAEDALNKVIICSAVSCLSRTACEIIMKNKCVTAKCSAPKPGEVDLVIDHFDSSVQDELTGITDFLIFGFIGVKKDYPESIKLKINNKEWYDGSQERWW